MDKARKTKISVALIIIFAVLLVGCICVGTEHNSSGKVQSGRNADEILFSEESGFFESSVSIELMKSADVSKDAVIYYTLNGDDPDQDSILYEEPILLEAGEIRSVYPVKARICQDGELSEIVCEKTYVVGNNISEDIEINIISLTLDSDNLYDHEKGILVDGATYAEFPVEGEGVNYWFTGNYSQRGDEWIRDAHIVMFDEDGELLLDQNVGMGVSGGTSSVMPVKSFKIMADITYDAQNPKLILDYHGDETYGEWSFVTEYNSLKLRNGSQDMITGNVRSALISRLAQECGFDGITATKRAALYLNGEFYAIADVKQRFNRSYLADRFDLDDTAKVEKLEITEASCLESAGIKQYFETDLNEPENMEQLEQVVDMDNLLLYYAIQVLSNNKDWPQNNFEMWHYTGEYAPGNPYTDGRWRFLIYDTDLTYHESPDQPFEDMLLSCLNAEDHAEGSVFPYVMVSDKYRNQFITILCDLMNTTFETEHILELVDEEYGKIDGENRVQYGDEYTDTDIAEQIDWLKDNISAREEQVRAVLKEHWGLEQEYELSVSASQGISASWGNRKLLETEEIDAIYYCGTEIEISQDAYPGYSFQYWLVNEVKVYEDELVISDKDIQDGKVFVQVVAERVQTSALVISEISAKGDGDWLKLSNLGTSSINLNDYYVSDDADLLLKYQLPDIVMAPGDSIIINCKNNQVSIGEYICNFSLNELETLYLSQAEGEEVVDTVSVPKMEEEETYGRYGNSNMFGFYRNLNDQRKVSSY